MVVHATDSILDSQISNLWFRRSPGLMTGVELEEALKLQARGTGVSPKTMNSVEALTFKDFIYYVFRPVEFLYLRAVDEHVDSSSPAERFWYDWNEIPWGDHWPNPLAQKLKVLLDEIPDLANNVIRMQKEQLYPFSTPLLSSISSIRYESKLGKLKEFDRGQPQYHQTFGDHLLGLMLLRLHELYIRVGYQSTLLNMKEILSLTSCQTVPLWKMADRNEYLEKFVDLLDLVEFRHYISQKRCPLEQRHAAGDLLESMLLILVENGRCSLAFLIVNFIICLVIRSNSPLRLGE